MKSTKLGFGLMRLPQLDSNDPKSIDLEESKKMVDAFIGAGYTYFDTAWMYHDFAGEKAVKDILTSRYPRNAYTLATKLHNAFVKCEEDRDRIFNQQCENCGVDFFDYYLLHGIKNNSIEEYEKLHCFEWLKALKENGKARCIGFSYHGDAALLDQLLTKYDWIEFVQLQLNYLDWDSERIQAGKSYQVCVDHGVPVTVMEPVKGGSLSKMPLKIRNILRDADPQASEASWAMRFAAGLPGVKMVLSGMSSMEQVEDNIRTMSDFKPLSEEEQKVIQKVADAINSDVQIPCTGCAYCKDGCPMNINIPTYFKLFNDAFSGVFGRREEYHKLTQTFGKASDCIGCGQCELMCPQHLTVIQHLKDTANFFEN